MAAPKDLIAQRSFRVEMRVSGAGGFDMPGQWDMLSGSGQTATTSDGWPAGEKTPVRFQGPALPKQITVSRLYSPSRDDPMIRQLRVNQASVRVTVIRSAINADGDVTGEPTTYIDCLVSDINDPAFDSASGDGARLELVLQPTSIK